MLDNDLISLLLENSFSVFVSLFCLLKIDRTLISMNENIIHLNHLLSFTIQRKDDNIKM